MGTLSKRLDKTHGQSRVQNFWYMGRALRLRETSTATELHMERDRTVGGAVHGISWASERANAHEGRCTCGEHFEG